MMTGKRKVFLFRADSSQISLPRLPRQRTMARTMDSEEQQQREARKTVWTFETSSFLYDMGSDMIFSVWPLFLTSVLGANMAVVGLVDGLGDAVVSISQAV